jgi:hypothetical protein
MKRLWNALIAGHLLGILTLGACYFASSFLLRSDLEISPAFTVGVSFSAFAVAFGIAFFLLPKDSQS